MTTVPSPSPSPAGPATPPTHPTRHRAPPDARRAAPVARGRAGAHLMIMATSFGVTVVFTRLYLSLTGWPQIGGGTFHIAHALWGGLLLAIASMLPLMWANRWALTVAAVLAGAGVGLFIDEVGKFITTDNDYFFPLAAPIIYLAFLAMLVLARRAARSRTYDARGQTYLVLDGLTSVADRNLDARSQADIRARLGAIGASDRPDLADLAARLDPYLAGCAVRSPVTPWARRRAALATRLERWERRLLPRPVHRVVLIVGALAVGAFSMLGVAVILVLLGDAPDSEIILDDRTIRAGDHDPAVLVASVGEVVVGLLLLTSVVLFVLRRDELGVRVGRIALVLVLAAVNVMVGYVDAELVVVAIVVELALLGLYARYATRFLS